mgnify:CR=1 FL=1
MNNDQYLYLDNAATSWPKPPGVAEAMGRFLAESAGNPGRAGHKLARAAGEVVEEARGRLATMINAEHADRVVLTHGCTDSVNMAIHGRLEPLRRCIGSQSHRPHVVSTAIEHNAVSRTLHCYAKDGLIELSIVWCDGTGYVAPDAVLNACGERTVLVCVSHASNAVGTIQPVGAIGRGLRAKAPNALFLVDAAQTAGHIPIDVQADGIDLLAIAGHKGLGGPTATGGLYVAPRAFGTAPDGERLFCTRSGGTGMMAPGLEMPDQLPDALEAGTANAVGFAGLLAAMDAHQPAWHDNEMDRAMRMIDELAAIPGVRVKGVRERAGRTSVVLFNVNGLTARDVGMRLDADYGIAVRGGTHCAPLLHQAIGTGEQGAVRASPGPTTTEADVARFVEAIRQIAAVPAAV